jgi:hypothetical protein
MVVEAPDLDPYVGPRPFGRTKEDQARFFGRDRETGEIVSLIVSHAVLLVYAQSGAGKTSLFEAQVAPVLEGKGFQVLPLARVRAAIPQDMDLARVRNIYASSALLSIAPDEDPGKLLRSSLKRFLRKQAAPRCLLFDQFEEIFTDESVFALRPTRWQEEQRAFFRQVAAAVAADPLLRVVFVIRKEHLAEIDRFAALFSEGLRTRFHLEPLSEQAALSAIRRPVEERTRRSFAEGAPEKLVEELLMMRVDVGGEVKEVPGRYVEPLHLQLVCESVWQDLRPEETVITEEDVRTYGDIDQVLGELYEVAVRAASASAHMREGRLRKRIESDFITPSGTRAPFFVDETADGKGTAEAVAELERRHLIRAKEWRPGARLYELTHDRLIEPIRTSNEAYHARGRWRRWLAAGVAIGALAGGIVTAVVLLTADNGGPFDLKRYATLPSRGKPAAALSSASFSPDSNYIVTAGADGVARIWNWSKATATPSKVLDASPKALSSASFSPDGNYIVTAGADGVARVWKKGKPVKKLSAGNSAPLSSASFKPDGDLVLTAGADGMVRLWVWDPSAATSTKPTLVFKASKKALSSASFSSDGNYIVTAGADGVARVWFWPANELKAELSTGELVPLSSASFSPDGKFVVTGSADGVARVWKWSAHRIENQLMQPARVTSTAFGSPGGHFVLTAGADGAARIWGWESDKDPAVLRQPAALSSAAFSPVGALVVTAGRDGFATIYAPNQVG